MLLHLLLRVLPHLPLHFLETHHRLSTLSLNQVYGEKANTSFYQGILIGGVTVGAIVGAGIAPLLMRPFTRK